MVFLQALVLFVCLFVNLFCLLVAILKGYYRIWLKYLGWLGNYTSMLLLLTNLWGDFCHHLDPGFFE